MDIKITKEPDYRINVVPEVDEYGDAVKDQYGHEVFKKEYDDFPVYTRMCPECHAVYEYRYPDLLELGDKAKINVNGPALGFQCPKCGATIVHWGNSEYMVERPPKDDTGG